MAGDGNYGGNGSIYFENNVGGARYCRGSDPIAIRDVGNGRGNFQVFLRYTTDAAPAPALRGLLQAAIAQMEAALNRLQAGATDVTVHLEVPAIGRNSEPTGPNAGWEVQVKW
jgi:hypothetical protein